MRKILVFFIILFVAGFGFLYYKTNLQFNEYISPINNYISNNDNKEPLTATLIFGGDVMLSRGIGNIIENEKDPNYHWGNIKEVFSSADIAFINLESVISDKGRDLGNLYSFRASPKTMEGLLYSGVDIVSVANNHVWDWGKEAFKDSIDRLWNNNIATVGAGMDYNEAHKEIVLMTESGIRVAYLGYTNLLPDFLLGQDSKPAVADIKKEDIIQDIKRVKNEKKPDHVVVTFHWGNEYETKHNSFQEEIAKASIDAGANIVIGHHPHVVQEVERYKEGVIAYSLGNLIFDQNFSKDTGWGLVLRIVVDKNNLIKTEKIPVYFNSTYVPEIGTIEEL